MRAVAHVTVEDIDLGWDALKQEMQSVDGDSVTVGVHEKDAARRAIRIASEAAINNVDAAVISEHGATIRGENGKSHYVPPRPFMSLTLKENVRNYATMIGNMFAQILKSKAQFGGKDLLGRLGGKMAGDMKRNISRGGKFQPLAPLTLKKRRDKGNFDERPLFDTGQLADSIWFEVQSK